MRHGGSGETGDALENDLHFSDGLSDNLYALRRTKETGLHFRGRLSVPEQSGPGLRVDLELDERHLLVTSEGEDLGRYPISQTKAERITGNRFRLTIGNETLDFAAEDAIGFSYEAMPALSGRSPLRPRLFGNRRSAGAVPAERAQSTLRPQIQPRKDVPIGKAEPEPEPVVGAASILTERFEPAELPAIEEAPIIELSRPVEDVPIEEVSGDTTLDEPVVEPATEMGDDAEVVSVDADPTVPSSVEVVDEVDEIDLSVTEIDPSADEVADEVTEAAAPDSSLEASILHETFGITLDEAMATPAASGAGDATTYVECPGIRSDGGTCGSLAIGAAGFCFAHDPALAGERKLMTERVNQTVRRARATDPDLEALVGRLELAVGQVQDGSLDPQQALAMASLVQAMCDTIGVSRRKDA